MRTIKRDIVGAFIFSDDDCLLLGKSSRGTYEGQWIVPGGGVEPGETHEQALVREVQEETGIVLQPSQIERMDIELSGSSKKILKTGEEVVGEYKFFNFVVNLDRKSEDIDLKPEDDFVEPFWCPKRDLKKMNLPTPTVTSLKHLGIL